jgi:hypothetical protein
MPSLIDQAPWDEYAARVAELFRPLAPGDGDEEPAVAAAEARLGFRLPRVLREMYLLAGHRDDVHRPKNHLIHPEDLSVEQGALVVYEENHNLVLWGVRVDDLGRDDPPVVRAYNDVALTWEDDHETLSGFFLTMLYWQAVNGGLPFSGVVADVDRSEIPEVHRHWPKVDLLGSLWHHLMVFHRGGQVVCISGHDPALVLHAAGKTRDDLDAITRRLKLDWDEAAVDDEAAAPEV